MDLGTRRSSRNLERMGRGGWALFDKQVVCRGGTAGTWNGWVTAGGSRRVGLIGRNSWNLEPMCRGRLFVASSRGWFRPICNTMDRSGSHPHIQQREREREQQRNTQSPGQPTPTSLPGKTMPFRAPPPR